MTIPPAARRSSHRRSASVSAPSGWVRLHVPRPPGTKRATALTAVSSEQPSRRHVTFVNANQATPAATVRRHAGARLLAWEGALE